MEAVQQATQRKISVESFDLIHDLWRDFQAFNELLVQYRRPRRKKPGHVLPDNMVVVHDEPIQAEGSYNVPLQPVPPYLVLEYVSKNSKRKDYEDNMEKYEHELKVPYYLIFYPDNQEMTLYQHDGKRVCVGQTERARPAAHRAAGVGAGLARRLGSLLVPRQAGPPYTRPAARGERVAGEAEEGGRTRRSSGAACQPSRGTGCALSANFASYGQTRRTGSSHRRTCSNQRVMNHVGDCTGAALQGPCSVFASNCPAGSRADCTRTEGDRGCGSLVLGAVAVGTATAGSRVTCAGCSGDHELRDRA